MGVWGVKGLVVRLVVALTVLVIAMQFLIALLTWEGTVQRRRRLTFTVEEGKDPAREVAVLEMGVVDVPGEQTSDTPSCSCGVEQVADRTSALLLGHPRRDRGFLTIGIPTVRREGGEYLFGTIDSLINCTTPEEKEETVLVIFLADFDPDIKKNATKELQLRYGNYLADGFMLVIEAPKTFYPSLENLKRTYNHPEKQVKWRSKQNYDYAFMFKYSSFLSTYYLQIEDDVQTTRNFLTAIKHYINDQTSPWVCLEFSTLGYIGKLYHSHDIEKLAKMLMLFYEEQPPDFLYLYFNVFLTQFQQRLRVPTLFQHMGYHSSLPDKVQPLKDNLFDNTVKQYHGDNPPATMYTNLETFAPFSPNLAYSLADGFFWAKESKKGDYLLLVFDRPEKLSSVIIDSGSEFHKDDRIQNATLEAAVTVVKKTPKEAECTNFVRLGTFVNGNIRVDKLPSLVPFDIFCFRVTLDQDHLNWLIFREIAVFR